MKVRNLFREIAIFLLFSIMTIAVTYPVAFYCASAVPQDPGDPLQAAWAISWNCRAILKGNLKNYWDANIFYPMSDTLALSPPYILSALLGMPVYLTTRNILLTYNFLFLLSFVLSGYATYRLAFYLTKSRCGSLLSGIAFAFTTYRFDHLGHLNLLQTQWMPLTLLSWLVFINGRKLRYAILTGILFAANALSSVYYFLFLSIIMTVLFPFVILKKANIMDRRIWLGTIIIIAVGIALSSPFLFHYAIVKNNLSLSRSMEEVKALSATFRSYFNGPCLTRIYAPWLSNRWRPEANFFPGFITLALAFACPIYRRNLRVFRSWISKVASFRPRVSLNFISSFCSIISLILLLISLLVQLLFVSLKLRFIAYTFIGFILSFSVVLLTNTVETGKFLKRYFIIGKTYRGFLFVMAFTAIILSFGPIIRWKGRDVIRGPYYFLYKHVPGFDGFRAIGRIGVMAVLAVCLLAAYGVADIERKLMNRSNIRLAVAIALIMGSVVESISKPIPIVKIPSEKNFPQVYKWLAKQGGEFVIAEIPMGKIFDDVRYMYFSILHEKKLVNGYSAYVPRNYSSLAEVINLFPDEKAVRALQNHNVRYLILHDLDKSRKPPRESTGDFVFVGKFGSDYVYEILDAWAPWRFPLPPSH